MPFTRRTFLAGAGTAGAAALLPSGIAAVRPAAASAPTASYADNVTFALQQGIDLWGETLLATPGGPTFDNVKPLLPPANLGSTYLTESGWCYLPFTDKVPEPATWLAQRDFTIHVADGSQITSQWCWADYPAQRQFVNFQVGDETYGSALGRLAEPKLWGDFLPVLDNDYTDAAGTRWQRESFAARVDGTLVSFVRFIVHKGSGPAETRLRLSLQAPGDTGLTSDGSRIVSGNDTYLISDRSGTWSAPNFDITVDLSSGSAELYLAILNEKAPATIRPGKQTYENARATIAAYWRQQLVGGATIDIPEPYALDAMRNLLLQNLVMGWQQAIANGYETGDANFAFVPEVSTSVAPLGEFGFVDSYRKNLQEILRRGQGDAFPNWEMGIKLQSAAHYYFLTNDATYLNDNLPVFTGYLDNFAAQRKENANGLLDKQNYGSDIPLPVYGLHHQADAWRGMRDFGIALRQIGETTLAAKFTTEAAGLRTALDAAVTASATRLADGSLYVPIPLLDPDASAAYPLIPRTRDGSYWNLTLPYAATGIFPPGSDEAKGVLRYLYEHGSLLLGLTRFNESGVDAGVIETGPVPPFPAGAGGYETTGVDQQYGYSLLKFLADNNENDRLVLEFYGKLAHELTPYTFICGEGATVGTSAERGRAYRSMWFPPLSANNAVYLHTLRELLVREERDADGVPRTLHLSPATPRGWLQSGKRIAVGELPTLFGPMSFSLAARGNAVTATVTPPKPAAGRFTAGKVVLHVRVPPGQVLRSATVDGRPTPCSGDSVDLGAPTHPVTVVVQLATVPVRWVDQARPAAVTPSRRLVRPGDILSLRTTVEVLGAGNVSGTVRVEAPTGWSATSQPFSVRSQGQIAWGVVDLQVRVASSAQAGTATVTLVTSAGGRREVPIEVGIPAADPYPKLVLADGPIGYWRLDETTGTTAKDSSGHGVDGVFTGAVTLGAPGAIAGDADRSVTLAGGFLDVPGKSVSVTGPFTVEAWIRPTGSQQQGLLEKYDSPAVNGYVFRLVEGNKVHLETLWETVPAQQPPPGATGLTTVTPGTWHHVAGVYDGSAVHVYLDGELEASAPAPNAPTAGAGNLRIGARGDDAGERLAGGLDEVAIYAKALPAETLKARYVNGILGRSYD